MVTPSENLPSLSTTTGNLRRGSSLNVLFFSKSSDEITEAECGGGELRRAGSLRLSRGDSGDAPRHHRDDRRPEETEVEDGNGNSSGNRGIGKRDPENRNLLGVPDDKGGSTRQQRKDTIAASVGRLVPESSSPARPARPNRHSAPAAAAAAAAAATEAAAAAAAAPAPEHLARSLLQLGCPVVSMPKPRGGVGSEQNAQASSDSDDSTTSHRGPHRHLANSHQQHHHAQPQGQIQGHSLAHQNTVHGYGLLPKVQVSSPPNTPESYHNGSAGSIGARSAPSTPLQGVVGSSQQQQNQQQQASQPIGGLQLTVASVSPPPPRSPSHAALRCQDSQLSKPLSRSTPSMTAGTVNRSSTRSSPSSTSSARQKKFHRHFSQSAKFSDQVTADERVLNYYSCALVGDILLQGHLYITPNYFAFYSNVFGYVTKLLIPTASVLKISKEKTARIIPNAVAVATLDGRHVFCSLLSRDSTFKLMKQVWDAALEARDPVTDLLPLPVEAKLLASPHSSSLVDDSEVNAEGDEEDEEEEDEEEEEEDSSMSESGTDLISRAPTVCTDTTDALTTATAAAATSIPRLSLTAARLEQIALPKRLPAERKAQIGSFRSFIRCGMRPATIIAILVGLLAALYVSAALMMLRIDRLHTAYVNHPLASPERLTQDRLVQYLASNLDQIVKVRQSLQTLSQQLVAINRESGTESALSARAIEPEESPS